MCDFSLGSTFGPTSKPSEEEMRDFYAAYRYNDGNTVASGYVAWCSICFRKGVVKM